MPRTLSLLLVLLLSFALAGCCWRPGPRFACQKQRPCACKAPCAVENNTEGAK